MYKKLGDEEKKRYNNARVKELKKYDAAMERYVAKYGKPERKETRRGERSRLLKSNQRLEKQLKMLSEMIQTCTQ